MRSFEGSGNFSDGGRDGDGIRSMSGESLSEELGDVMRDGVGEGFDAVERKERISFADVGKFEMKKETYIAPTPKTAACI